MAYAMELCGSKLRSKLGGTLNESVSAPTSSFAKKQLEKMGWKEGESLGKRKDGMTSHIRVKKRLDNEGLGHGQVKVTQASDTWWNSNITDTLSRLQQSSGGVDDKRKKKKKKKEDRKEKKKKRKKQEDEGGGVARRDGNSIISAVRSYTDEELFVATGGARFGMRAQRRATGKWARTERLDEAARKLEGEAKKSMEWDGTGRAKLLLSATTSTSTTVTTTTTSSSKCSSSSDVRCSSTITSRKTVDGSECLVVGGMVTPRVTKEEGWEETMAAEVTSEIDGTTSQEEETSSSMPLSSEEEEEEEQRRRTVEKKAKKDKKRKKKEKRKREKQEKEVAVSSSSVDVSETGDDTTSDAGDEGSRAEAKTKDKKAKKKKKRKKDEKRESEG